MTWAGSLRVQLVEDIATATARQPFVIYTEGGVDEPEFVGAGMHHDSYLGAALILLRRFHDVPPEQCPPGLRSILITCAHCGRVTLRDARSRYCDDECRINHNRPLKLARWREKRRGRKRCQAREVDGRKCRGYPRQGHTVCTRHGTC